MKLTLDSHLINVLQAALLLEDPKAQKDTYD